MGHEPDADALESRHPEPHRFISRTRRQQFSVVGELDRGDLILVAHEIVASQLGRGQVRQHDGTAQAATGESYVVRVETEIGHRCVVGF